MHSLLQARVVPLGGLSEEITLISNSYVTNSGWWGSLNARPRRIFFNPLKSIHPLFAYLGMRRKAAAFEVPFDREEKLDLPGGLPDEVVRAVLHRLDGRLYIAEGRDDEVGLLLGFWLEARSRRFEMEKRILAVETLRQLMAN
jgi:hypothetical protein